jgi:hypothetical protein
MGDSMNDFRFQHWNSYTQGGLTIEGLITNSLPKLHKLENILIIALCVVICGAVTWVDTRIYRTNARAVQESCRTKEHHLAKRMANRPWRSWKKRFSIPRNEYHKPPVKTNDGTVCGFRHFGLILSHS